MGSVVNKAKESGYDDVRRRDGRRDRRRWSLGRVSYVKHVKGRLTPEVRGGSQCEVVCALHS